VSFGYSSPWYRTPIFIRHIKSGGPDHAERPWPSPYIVQLTCSLLKTHPLFCFSDVSDRLSLHAWKSGAKWINGRVIEFPFLSRLTRRSIPSLSLCLSIVDWQLLHNDLQSNRWWLGLKKKACGKEDRCNLVREDTGGSNQPWAHALGTDESDEGGWIATWKLFTLRRGSFFFFLI
jgi:hypothetical protein